MTLEIFVLVSKILLLLYKHVCSRLREEEGIKRIDMHYILYIQYYNRVTLYFILHFPQKYTQNFSRATEVVLTEVSVSVRGWREVWCWRWRACEGVGRGGERSLKKVWGVGGVVHVMNVGFVGSGAYGREELWRGCGRWSVSGYTYVCGVGCVGVRGCRGVWGGPGVQILGLRDTHSHSGYLGKSGHLDSSSHKRQWGKHYNSPESRFCWTSTENIAESPCWLYY